MYAWLIRPVGAGGTWAAPKWTATRYHAVQRVEDAVRAGAGRVVGRIVPLIGDERFGGVPEECRWHREACVWTPAESGPRHDRRDIGVGRAGGLLDDRPDRRQTWEPAARHQRMPPALLTKLQAADRLGVGERTLERMLRSGELPGVRIGRLVRVRVSDVEACVERGVVRRGERAGERSSEMAGGVGGASQGGGA